MLLTGASSPIRQLIAPPKTVVSWRSAKGRRKKRAHPEEGSIGRALLSRALVGARVRVLSQEILGEDVPDKVVVHHGEAERAVCKVAVGYKDGVRAEAESLPKGRHGDGPKRLVVRAVGRVAKVEPPLDDAQRAIVASMKLLRWPSR